MKKEKVETHLATPRHLEKEREEFHLLLEQNPNYFGQLKKSKFKPIAKIQGDTSFEQLKCVGLYPEANAVEAILEVKRPFGFGGDLCQAGSHEYVRFYLDWDRDGDFDQPFEDLGVVALEVHDISEVVEQNRETHLCYAVRRPFKTHPSRCEEPFIIKLRAVLAWEQIPTSPDFPMVWGNIMECLVQVDPEGILKPVSAPTAVAKRDDARQIEPERQKFLELLAENPNYFGTVAASPNQPGKDQKSDTHYEELKCLGLFPEENLLEAVFVVKLPFGFDGPLCSPGSHEFISFFVDWNNDGDFTDPGESIGFSTVRVHDIPEVKPGDPKTYLCYATAHVVRPRESTCQTPLIVRARAVLSWQVPTPGPNGPVVWGNIVDCMVQFRPTQRMPPLTAVITTPVADVCVSPVTVFACFLDGHPLWGVQITGSAEGFGFGRYNLSYRWGGGPWIHDAVVYPACVRAGLPVDPGSAIPVHNGTLGYLDALLLPPGITEFEVWLEVFPTAGPALSAFGSFKLTESAVYVDEVATRPVIYGEDPFFLGNFFNLVKNTADDSVAVPEQSVGGAFSIHGSAYFAGCDRIMSQYVLARYGALPAVVVPTFADADQPGNTKIITPVPYNDTPTHPWNWHCGWPPPGVGGTNVIENGNLVAQWVTDCCFAPFPVPPNPCGPNHYPVYRVSDYAWPSSPLNGRFVLLLEVQDVPVLPPHTPIDKTVYQVVAWIDNQTPVAEISSIGGKVKCDDIHLKDYLNPRKKADFDGKAWDWPIDVLYPQQPPNDNFGSYSIDFWKNGGIPGGSVPVTTPNNRVGTPAWGAAPPTVDGLLTQWDIVAALDAGNAPTPYVDPGVKLYRGERCAYVFWLHVVDTTWVGDSGNHHEADFPYAVTIINDIPGGDPFPEPPAP